jgi:uncharacterized membrane protein YedE/YeeE
MTTSLRLPYLAVAATSGLLFGAGLYISQMVDPLKVLRFLDFGAIPAGGWDPSLAFVIVAAIAVMFTAVRFGKARPAPAFDTSFHQPAQTRIDAPLIIGSVLFGIGWGMSGICPGPAISLVAFWPADLLYFLLPLVAGSYLGSLILRGGRSKETAAA